MSELGNEGHPQGRKLDAAPSGQLFSFEEVRREELKRIHVRRRAADQQVADGSRDFVRAEPTAAELDEIQENLVGVSLSGGGIRSGAFSLGVLLGLARGGLLRFVDYLSTVSGGGYAGAALSAESVERLEQDKAGKDAGGKRFIFEDDGGGHGAAAIVHPHPKNNPARPYPPAMRGLVIKGSRWLRDRRPFETLSRLFLGGLMTAVLVASLTIALCAALAWSFRWLHTATLYDWLLPLGIKGDILVLLTPTFLAGFLWLLLWLGSGLRYGRRGTGQWARRCFSYVFVPVTVCSLVLIATSGNVDIRAWMERWGLTEEESASLKTPLAWVLPIVVAAIVTSLLPFLAPAKLLESGRQEAGTRKHMIFRIARLGLLLGAPLLIFSVVASENISGWNTRRDARFGDSDLITEALFDHLRLEYAYDARPVEEVSSSTEEPESATHKGEISWKIPGTRLVFGAYGTVAEKGELSESKLSLVLPGTYLATGIPLRGDLGAAKDLPEWPLFQFEKWRTQSVQRSNAAMAWPQSNGDQDDPHPLLADNSWGDERGDMSLWRRLWNGIKLIGPDDGDNPIAVAAGASRASRMWGRESLYVLNQRLSNPYLYLLVKENLGKLADLYPQFAEGTKARKRLEQRIAEARLVADHLETDAENRGETLDASLQGRLTKEANKIETAKIAPILATALTEFIGIDPTSFPKKYKRRRAIYRVSSPANKQEDETRVNLVMTRLKQIHDNPASQHNLAPLFPRDQKDGHAKKDDQHGQQLDQDHVPFKQQAERLHHQQDDRQVFAANRALLEALYPDSIRPLTKLDEQYEDLTQLKGGVVYSRHVLFKDQQTRWWIFVGAILIGLVAAFFVDLNTFSWHGFYAERLAIFWVRSGQHRARNRKQTTSQERIPLHQLNTVEAGRPYHLINASTHTFARGAAHRDDVLGMPNRPFLLSEKFVGTGEPEGGADEKFARKKAPPPGFQLTAHEAYNYLSLSDATALSGAAVSPWATPNRLAEAIMFILNLRTGLWLSKPRRRPPRRRSKPLPKWLEQVTNRLHNRGTRAIRQQVLSRFVHSPPFFPPIRFVWSWLWKPDPSRWNEVSVTDGGFYENLGLESLLRRRCRLMIAVDATQDEDYTFDSLAKVVRRCRMLYGIEFLDYETNRPLSFPLSLAPLHGSTDEQAAWHESRSQFCPIRVDYGAAEESSQDTTNRSPQEALLLLVKANLVKSLPIDVMQHARRNKQFPNDPTTDQFYTVEKFESYRQLGDAAACQVVGKILERYNLPPFEKNEESRIETLSIRNQADLIEKIDNAFTPPVHAAADAIAEANGEPQTRPPLLPSK